MNRARSLVAGLAFGGVALVSFLVVMPVAFGWRPLTVMSGSMEPTISTGDVVVTRPIAATAIRSGQVITFRDPEEPSRLLTHRVRRVDHTGAKTDVVTQGDANTGVERWSMATDGSVGSVAYRLPYLGYVLHPAQSPAGRLLLIGLPVLVWGALVLRDIWRTDGRVADAAPAPAAVTAPAALSTDWPPPRALCALPVGTTQLALPAAPRMLALPPGAPLVGVAAHA